LICICNYIIPNLRREYNLFRWIPEEKAHKSVQIFEVCASFVRQMLNVTLIEN